MELREPLVHFLRVLLGYHRHFHLTYPEVTPYYDTIYKLNNVLFLNRFMDLFRGTTIDVVVSDIRYLNELKALQESDFIIVRVTDNSYNKKVNIGRKVKTAAENTVVLSMLYDKNFASNYNVKYSLVFNGYESLASGIRAILEQNGYNFEKKD